MDQIDFFFHPKAFKSMILENSIESFDMKKKIVLIYPKIKMLLLTRKKVGCFKGKIGK